MTITASKTDTRDPEYMNIHRWLARHYGPAKKCVNGHDAKTYQWANITGIYERDIKNFQQLCRSCHCKIDYSEYQRQFHSKRMTGNTYRRKAVAQYKNGKKLRTYPTVTDAAKHVGVVRTAITNVITGRAKKAGGYEWRVVS